MRAVGIDISHWQGSFKNLGNIDFIIQKVSDGLYKDSLYDELLPSVKTVEHRGGYHWFRTDTDPIAQAEFFYKAQAGQGFQFLAMDYERHGNSLDARGEKNLWIFYQKLLELTSKTIYLYTTEYVLRDNLLIYNDRWLDVPFWVARYNPGLDEQTVSPLFLDLGNDWAIWQYSADGNKKGGEYGVGSADVDLNVWNDKFIKEPEMKKFYTSKTLWFNVVGVVFLWILPAIFPDFVLQVPAEFAVWKEPVILLVNLILRIFTNQGVEV